MIKIPNDPYLIPPDQKSKYEAQFHRLSPVNGLITGEQAKGLFLMSGLPHPILAKIWQLSDVDADGCMDINEFCIALHLIALKLKGIELPNTLPQSLKILVDAPKFDAFGVSSSSSSSVSSTAPLSTGIPVTSLANLSSLASAPLASSIPITTQVSGPPGRPPPPKSFDPLSSSSAISTNVVTSAIGVSSLVSNTTVSMSTMGAADANRVRTGSIPLDGFNAPSATGSMLTEWAIPQQSKLKYTQMFNSHDRTRTGFLTGPQARNILLQSGLQQQVLAQIWNLSDIDTDGRLTCEEFVLAMHLIDSVKAGDILPAVLPADLIPPSQRRKRSVSGTTAGLTQLQSNLIGDLPVTSSSNILVSQGSLEDHAKATFEDKRRENFEKGQAELDRRRQMLLDAQRKEQHERERKEREEAEKRERQRLEQEQRRQQEIERQMQRQREIEQEKEEQRRKLLEQREAARREMERQRLIEWENQRMLELQLQKQKLIESLSLLKTRKTNIILETEKVNKQYQQSNENVIETRKKLADLKLSIDKMKDDRDIKLKEINFLKSQMKNLQDRQLLIEHDKITISKQLKEIQSTINMSNTPGVSDSVSFALQSKQSNISQLNNQISDIENEIKLKNADLEEHIKELNDLKSTFSALNDRTKELQNVFDEKRADAIKIKETATGVTQDTIAAATATIEQQQRLQQNGTAVHGDDWAQNGMWSGVETDTGVKKEKRYRAVFKFESRNEDELSVDVGDIITVVADEGSADQGWVKGTFKGNVGWLPETYLELIDEFAQPELSSNTSNVHTKLEGISEVPEEIDTFKAANTFKETETFKTPETPKSLDEPMAIALYPWQGKEDNHLSFNKGDLITIKEQQDIWWSGELNQKIGWFPKSFVRLLSSSNFDGGQLKFQPEYCIALYPFETQEAGDLSFDTGEIIMVTKKEGEWWTGEIGDRSGIFPCNYVREAQIEEVPKPPEPAPKSETNVASNEQNVEAERETPTLPDSVQASPMRSLNSPKLKKTRLKKQEIVKVIAPYKSTGPEQLNLEKGQLIQVRKKNASGWWEGEIQVRGGKRQVGWFPATYVKPLNATGGSGSGGSSARSTPDLSKTEVDSEKVISMFAFKALHDDEISFEANEVIKVISKDDETWWKGQLLSTLAIGLFPSNHVKPYDEKR